MAATTTCSPSWSGKSWHGGEAHSDLSWDDIKRIEKTRRTILKRVEHPFWRILGYWRGTCVQTMYMEWMIWIPILLFIAIRVQARTGHRPDIVDQLDAIDLSVLGGFLSFLLVLFVNQTQSRFFEMYKMSRACAGRVQDVAGFAASRLPAESAHRLVRHLNAAHVLGYVGLGGPYTKENFFDHYNRKAGLLVGRELEHIAAYNIHSGSGAFKELCTWCEKCVEKELKAGNITSHEAVEFHCQILAFRAAMDGIYDTCDQPPHFYYIHFLCLLTVLYLPLFAVESALKCGWGGESDLSVDILSGLIVIVQSIFVIGLRLLGQKMIDPYGEDYEDLSVIEYVESTSINCRVILTSQDEHGVDPAVDADGYFRKNPLLYPPSDTESDESVDEKSIHRTCYSLI